MGSKYWADTPCALLLLRGKLPKFSKCAFREKFPNISKCFQILPNIGQTHSVHSERNSKYFQMFSNIAKYWAHTLCALREISKHFQTFLNISKCFQILPNIGQTHRVHFSSERNLISMELSN